MIIELEANGIRREFEEAHANRLLLMPHNGGWKLPKDSKFKITKDSKFKITKDGIRHKSDKGTHRQASK